MICYQIEHKKAELPQQKIKLMGRYTCENSMPENESLDDFNYVHFMEKYNLTTICDETFVKNEYLKLKEN